MNLLRTLFIPFSLTVLLSMLVAIGCAGVDGNENKMLMNPEIVRSKGDSMKAKPESPLKKREPSSFADQPGQASESYPFLPDSDLGRLLRRHFLNSAAFGASSEAKFIDSLQEIRSRDIEVANALKKVYPLVEKRQYFVRWLITNTLAQLISGNAVSALSEIAQSTIPAEEFDVSKTGISSVALEATIRLAAVRGLSLLAKQRHLAAEETLANLAEQGKNKAVKTMAIQGYLGAAFSRKTHGNWPTYLRSPEYAQRLSFLKDLLPERDAPLLRIQPVLEKDLDSFKVDFKSEKKDADYHKSRQRDRAKRNQAPVLENTPGQLELKHREQLQNKEMEGIK